MHYFISNEGVFVNSTTLCLGDQWTHLPLIFPQFTLFFHVTWILYRVSYEREVT